MSGLDDVPAFPCTVPHSAEGMTLLDYFAAQAMAGDWAAQNEETGQFVAETSDRALAQRAGLYYRMGRAMLMERVKTTP